MVLGIERAFYTVKYPFLKFTKDYFTNKNEPPPEKRRKKMINTYERMYPIDLSEKRSGLVHIFKFDKKLRLKNLWIDFLP